MNEIGTFIGPQKIEGVGLSATEEGIIAHAADQKISLDLDDGVKVNYGKFGDLLAEAKSICGSKEEE